MIILDWRYFCRRYLFDAYDYKAYNEATISHNIEIVREKAARKNKELSPEEILTETCRELSKKHTDKRARRKKGSVPSVSQMQNHMNTGT